MYIKELTGTLLFSFAISTSFNSTIMPINVNMQSYHLNSIYNNPSTNSSLVANFNNIYVKNGTTKLEKEAEELFGNMRYLTNEEQDIINNYIDGISISTGVNFFNL